MAHGATKPSAVLKLKLSADVFRGASPSLVIHFSKGPGRESAATSLIETVSALIRSFVHSRGEILEYSVYLSFYLHATPELVRLLERRVGRRSMQRPPRVPPPPISRVSPKIKLTDETGGITAGRRKATFLRIFLKASWERRVTLEVTSVSDTANVPWDVERPRRSRDARAPAAFTRVCVPPRTCSTCTGSLAKKESECQRLV